jgi:HTH-type transcriptional regulator/antitoxin HigA
MRIQPVRTEAEHDAAVTRIQELMGAEAGTEASDELEVLVTLVDAYETKNFPIDMPDPVTVIKFQMEQQGISRKDLEPMIGSRARVSEILTGKRALTLPMIRRLHDGLNIPADLLVGISTVSPPSARRAKRKSPLRVHQTDRDATAQRSAR